MKTSHLFTSESVSEGHPDKVCDQISDAILDACLEHDPNSRVAVETLAKGDTITLAGELTTNADIDVENVARRVVRDVGYTDPGDPFNADSLNVRDQLTEQAPEIKQKADAGAGDQGLMFGYATDETPALMPLPILLAHRLAQSHAEDRRNSHAWLGPDAKTQVTVAYEDDQPRAVHKVLVSTQHASNVSQQQIADYVQEKLVPRVLGDWHQPGLEVIVNPKGSFEQGGPSADAGLTGRKIIVDTYGGTGRHGGGAFSGKDPTKVDRSGAYFARYVARQIVLEELARRVEVQVSYAIGLEEPFSLNVNTFGTGDEREAEAYARQFDFRPRAIIDRLDLRRPIYLPTATYGHFGRPEFSWEQ